VRYDDQPALAFDKRHVGEVEPAEIRLADAQLLLDRLGGEADFRTGHPPPLLSPGGDRLLLHLIGGRYALHLAAHRREPDARAISFDDTQGDVACCWHPTFLRQQAASQHYRLSPA
jgi:hypothetical protein